MKSYRMPKYSTREKSTTYTSPSVFRHNTRCAERSMNSLIHHSKASVSQ